MQAARRWRCMTPRKIMWMNLKSNRLLRNGLRLLLLAALMVLLVAAWRGHGLRHAAWAYLAAHHAAWAAAAGRHALAAAGLFVGVYALTVALYIPVGTWLSLGAGLCFGIWLGGALTVLGASIGAIGAYAVARRLLAPLLGQRLERPVARLKPGLEQDGFSYLLALRLVPLFPFWLVNLAPALAGMRLQPYVLATALGVIPISFVLNAIGAGLGATLDAGGHPDMEMLLRLRILLPLLVLAALALAPALWRRWRRTGAG